MEESQTRKYPESELSEALIATVEEADKCQTVANQLGNKKVCKVEKILEGSLDSIPSPSPSVKSQIIGVKVYLT